MRRRGTYAKNLVKQIKVRIDETTFKQITQISDKKEKTKSWIMRDIISNGLTNRFKPHQ
jgi:predicted DNA-binding protein